MPVELGDLASGSPADLYVDAPSLNTAAHRDAMVRVLRLYQQKFLLIEGKLYITTALANDRDMLMNYTSKAEEIVAGRGDYMFPSK